VSLVSQWIDEAKSKLNDPGLVYAYHGQSRKRDVMVLAENAIIVTTYATLAKDATYHADKAFKNGKSDYCPPCEQIRWWRIICDESHTLKQDTVQTKAVMNLVGDHKWAVSGKEQKVVLHMSERIPELRCLSRNSRYTVEHFFEGYRESTKVRRTRRC
jgi:SNF2 family DNA or RNA helicase